MEDPSDVRRMTARKYSLTFDVIAHNVLNYQNLGMPNGR